MNWFQKQLQKHAWGLENLEDQVTYALQMHPTATHHYKGTFWPRHEEETGMDHNHPRVDNRRTYVNSQRDIALGLYFFKDRNWSDSVQVQVYLSDGLKRFGFANMYSKVNEIRQFPSAIVEKIYDLIDNHFGPPGSDGDDDGDEPDWSPEPTVGIPVGVGV